MFLYLFILVLFSFFLQTKNMDIAIGSIHIRKLALTKSEVFIILEK